MGISDSASTYPQRHSFQSLCISIKSLRPAAKNLYDKHRLHKCKAVDSCPQGYW